LLSPDEARREAEEFLHQFVVLYPDDRLVRTALRGAAAYQLSWFDAHMWAYAEHFGLAELWSEDFQHDRRYGTVRVVNPFLGPLP
jgi:predicted nucleic acid-binding protein